MSQPPARGGLSPSPDLLRACRAPQLFNTIGPHGGAGPPVPELPAVGVEEMRPPDSDIAGREGVRLSPLPAVIVPGHSPLTRPGGIVLGVLVTAAMVSHTAFTRVRPHSES